MSFQYNVNYDSSLLRGKDDPSTLRPWDLRREVLKHSGNHKKLLDVGCGTSFKLIPIAPAFEEVTAVDINQKMVCASRKLFIDKEIKNTNLITADSNFLPFLDNSFDVVTHMLSRFNLRETQRVLKPQGVVIVEYPGCEDKKEFKKLFGKDHNGWRGQFINDEPEIFLDKIHQQFKQYFSSVIIKNGFWNTFYNREGVIELLQYTPTIRDFNKVSDNDAVNEACEMFMTPQGIKLEQNRVLIYATNS